MTLTLHKYLCCFSAQDKNWNQHGLPCHEQKNGICTGLDAAAAYFVMDTIRTLAQRNRTVLTVIHQPSSEVFELFDQVGHFANDAT